MWWPAIGGLAIGLGGLVFPQALGVGYDTIAALLQGDVTTKVILGVLLVKWFIWAVSLGSGTSGGVLAPLLMMGGALGGLEARFLPHEGAGFWPLISMGAILGGTMRCPFTSIVFAFELTHDANIFLPLLVSSVIAHAFTVLTLRRSILTEKVARRGYHLSREYAIDPLEILFVREVMRTKVAVLPATSTLGEIWQSLRTDHRQEQRLLPVVDPEGQLVGVLTRLDISERIELDREAALRYLLREVVRTDAVEAYPDEPLRVVVYRMAEKGVTRMPVVERGTRTFLGLVSLNDLLKARTRHLEEESRRERTLKFRFFFPGKRHLRPDAGWRPTVVPASVLVLFAPGCLHYDLARHGRGERDRTLLLPQAHLRVQIRGHGEYRNCSLGVSGLGAPHVRCRHVPLFGVDLFHVQLLGCGAFRH
jgi:CBS domain-containing protein